MLKKIEKSMLKLNLGEKCRIIVPPDKSPLILVGENKVTYSRIKEDIIEFQTGKMKKYKFSFE